MGDDNQNESDVDTDEKSLERGEIEQADIVDAVKAKSQNNIFFCWECDKAFISKGHLRRHKNTHAVSSIPNKFKCDECGVKFEFLRSLIRHTKSHDLEQMSNNTRCGIGEPLSTHQPVTSKQNEALSNSFPCQECGKGFKSLMSLNGHYKSHELKQVSQNIEEHGELNRNEAPETKFKCQICEKILKSAQSLKDHTKSHNLKQRGKSKRPNQNEGPSDNFKCNICGKVLTSLVTFKSHKKWHKLREMDHNIRLKAWKSLKKSEESKILDGEPSETPVSSNALSQSGAYLIVQGHSLKVIDELEEDE